MSALTDAHREAGEPPVPADDPAVIRLMGDRAWRRAVAAAPRRLFVPPVIWVPRTDGPGLVAVDRVEDEAGWRAAVERDDAIITQVDDGRAPRPGTVGRVATSSASQPRLVFRMLEALDVHDGMRVLEIGTGTGWNAGLLAARLGAEAVTTVEVDAAVAAQARAALSAAGLGAVTVVTGDGADGYEARAPYDRLIATCGVHRVPTAWAAQTAAGGVVLVPWNPTFGLAGGLARLVADGAGGAEGPFVGPASFMWLRAQRPASGGPRVFAEHEEDAMAGVTAMDVAELYTVPAASFAVGVRLPGVRWSLWFGEDEARDEATLWLTDDAGSWAVADYVPGACEHATAQYGPRRLWDEVEAASRWWHGAGRPDITAFGLSLDAETGTTAVWYRSPDGPRRPVAG